MRVASEHAHTGTPPVTPIILALPQTTVVGLLTMLIQWTATAATSAEPLRARLHWMHALMAVVDKPLTPDVCAALRDLARWARRARQAVRKQGVQITCMNVHTR